MFLKFTFLLRASLPFDKDSFSYICTNEHMHNIKVSPVILGISNLTSFRNVCICFGSNDKFMRNVAQFFGSEQFNYGDSMQFDPRSYWKSLNQQQKQLMSCVPSSQNPYLSACVTETINNVY